MPPRSRRPALTISTILAWADAFHARIGGWPKIRSGHIPRSQGLNWKGVNNLLCNGGRGLPGNSSLARLLAEHRGVRNNARLPPLTDQQILEWADAHQRRTAAWPTHKSGTIAVTQGENWLAVNAALCYGRRGQRGGSSLAKLLAKHRGARNPRHRPLTVQQILTWADAFHARTGHWPNENSGPVADAPGETWTAVCMALQRGHRGLRGRSSLPRLLAEHRGARLRMQPPRLSVRTVLSWADAHKARTGKWPDRNSGAIPGVPGETWRAVDHALLAGRRGLPKGSSLVRLLASERGARNRRDLPRLTTKLILSWANSHRRRTGIFPTLHGGVVTDAPNETWLAIDNALRYGRRGLHGRTTLAMLLGLSARKHGS